MRFAKICLLLIGCASAIDVEPAGENPNPIKRNVSPYMLSNGKLRSTNIFDQMQPRQSPFSVFNGNGPLGNDLDPKVSSNEDNIEDLEDDISSLKIEIEDYRAELELDIDTHTHDHNSCTCTEKCPFPYKDVLGHCLLVVAAPEASFPDSKTYCIHRGGHLAVPDVSWTSAAFVAEFTAAFSLQVLTSKSYWIGLEYTAGKSNNFVVVGLDGSTCSVGIIVSNPGSITITAETKITLIITTTGSGNLKIEFNAELSQSTSHSYICAYL